jgi:hypothetical protein
MPIIVTPSALGVLNLLDLVKKFCGRTNISSPATVYGSADPQIKQIMSLLEEEGNDLAVRGDWQALTLEATWTSVAAEDQGAITTIATNGFRKIKDETFWDRNLKLRVNGPVSDKEWQALKAMTVTGPRYNYRLRNGHLLANPTPTAGHTWAFEYVSYNWIIDSNGLGYGQYFSNDTDYILLPNEIVLLGLRWRWKREKGLDYAEDFRTYEIQVNKALGGDGGKTTLNMGDSERSGPMVFIPAGNWVQP